MPHTVSLSPKYTGPAPNRLRWARTPCDAIRDVGVLTGRYKLIDGEMIAKGGQKPPHSQTVRLLTRALVRPFGGDCVPLQSNIELSSVCPDYDEPEPDAAGTADAPSAYGERHPGPEDLLRVVEDSDATLRFDLSRKAALCAFAGIPEYRVVDVAGRQADGCWPPPAAGYGEVSVCAPEEPISPPNRWLPP